MASNAARELPSMVQPGDVVQVAPDVPDLGLLFVVVQRVADWGIVGYFFGRLSADQHNHGERPPVAPFYVRIENGKFRVIGPAAWTLARRA